MKLPGFLTPLGLKLAAGALALVALIVLLGGGHIFSPGPLSAASPTGAVLGGVRSHAELGANCDACHPAPWSAQSMDGLCTACHTEIQAELADPATLHGMLDARNCSACHLDHRGPAGTQTRLTRLEVDHDRFGFSLAKHEKTAEDRPFACADCHTESLTRFDRSRCETCHRGYEDPFVTAHVGDWGADCQACHDGTDNFSGDRFDHNKLGYPLLGKHADASVVCTDCHAPVRDLAGFKDAPVDCVGCHEKDNKHPPNWGTDCARCHNTDGWPTEIFDHNLSTFKLVGKHVDVKCEQCHANRVFRGTPQDCVACHVQDDVHSLMLGTDCAKCHSPEDWKRVQFDHNQTAYKLTGKHVDVASTKCHVNNIFAGTPQECVACHAKDDVHQGVFGTDCTVCHGTDTWKRGPFEHTFPLDHGGKGIIACTTCHTVPADYKAYTCYNCHNPEDIRRLHAFAEVMGTDITDCVRCHPTGQPTMQMH